VQGASVDARIDLHPVTRRFQGTSISGGAFGTLGGLGLTWYSSYNPITSDVQSSQTRLFGSLGPPTRPWRVEWSVGYDIHNKSLQNQRYVFRWRGSCWAAVAELRDDRNQLYPNRSYRISIDLTGIGTFLEIKGGLDSGH
jgi:hypothetical protein